MSIVTLNHQQPNICYHTCALFSDLLWHTLETAGKQPALSLQLSEVWLCHQASFLLPGADQAPTLHPQTAPDWQGLAAGAGIDILQ